ncbi:MAG TPA: nuclear transport factor 2 family protein [Methylocystis sp.]|nr:nuclear transport factor 2 family protein [Methylocystis sp.]
MVQGAEGPTRLTRGEIYQRLSDVASLRLERRLDLLLEHFAPSVVVYRNCSREGLFNRGVLKGREAFRQALRLVDEDYLAVDGEIRDVLIEDQRAWMRWRTRWRHIGSQGLYDLDMAYFFRWENGGIVELHEFLDRPIPSPATGSLRESLEELVSPKPSGLTREEMLELIRALAKFPTTEGPDIATFRKSCSPSIVCEFVGDRARIPYAGRHVGVDALTNIMRGIATEFEQLSQKLSDIVIDDGRVGLRRSVEWRHRGTGRRGVVELAELMRFENGLMVEAIEYRDSIKILEMQD